MARRHGRDRAQCRPDLLVFVLAITRQLERDESAAAIGRDQGGVPGIERRADVARGVRQRGQRRGHLPRGPAHGRVSAERMVGSGPAPLLDQHALGGRAGHAQPVQHLLGLAGLAGVVRRHVLRGQQVPGHEDRGHQEQPAEHGGLAVPGTPARHPFHDGWAGRARLLADWFGFRQY
jgi:hypothetical protein